MFVIEQNPLNNHWMVHSKDETLPPLCYGFQSKKEAKELADKLNANIDKIREYYEN